MRLLPLRHAETNLNQHNLVQGLSQAQLSKTGKRQAQALAFALEKEPLAAVYSSPLTRALQTARSIAQSHKLNIQTISSLREVDVGDMEGLSASHLWARYPEFMAQWGQDASIPMPKGESLQQVQNRVWPHLEELLKRHRGETVVVVSHNFVIQVILAKMLGMATVDALNLRIGLAAINEVLWHKEHWILARLNDTCHLD